jgi:predicted Zn-dependent protease
MATYSRIDSRHFSVLLDPTQDELLGRYMSRYLESIYPVLAARFGYAPPGQTKIEILKNHQWFSGRTVGLPFVPTVGACTGRVVALASPRATRVPFNWARVLTHELVHVITLQQTEFNIPHWYTEALAVDSEGYPRPQDWNRLLLERVPKRTKLLNLDTINLGFIRPNEPDDRQMAYCQAQLYARYMLKRFGPDAQIKMLMAYRRGLTTDRAVAQSFHVEKQDFEKGYLAYLDDEIKSIRTRVSDDPVPFSQLERKLKEKPEDPDLNAQMAYEHFARRDLKEARPFADKALKLQPHHPLASYVKAQLLVTIGDNDAALEVLEPALDPKKPNERVIDLLGELKMKAGQLDDAEKLYEIAHHDDPFRITWISWLARIHLRQKKTGEFLSDMARIASFDADNIDVRKALAERYLAQGDAGAAEKWAGDCLHINVYDPAIHVLLADARAAGKRYAEAVEEYQTALELKVKKPDDVRVKLAKAQLGLDRRDAARAILDGILKGDPDHPEAKALKQQLESAKSG